MFLNPRLQGGVALRLAAVVLGGACLFAFSFHNYARSALRIASLQGHYHFLNPHEIIGETLARHIAVFSAGVFAVSILVLLVLVHGIRKGAGRLAEIFDASKDGDLSSPSNAGGLPDLAVLGKRIDSVRGDTLAKIREIAAEAEFLRREPLSDEEFARRWDGLKAAIRKVAP